MILYSEETEKNKEKTEKKIYFRNNRKKTWKNFSIQELVVIL